MTSHPQGVMPQSDLELPQTKSIFQTSFNDNNKFASETKAQRARLDLENELNRFNKTP